MARCCWCTHKHGVKRSMISVGGLHVATPLQMWQVAVAGPVLRRQPSCTTLPVPLNHELDVILRLYSRER